MLVNHTHTHTHTPVGVVGAAGTHGLPGWPGVLEGEALGGGREAAAVGGAALAGWGDFWREEIGELDSYTHTNTQQHVHMCVHVLRYTSLTSKAPKLAQSPSYSSVWCVRI